MLSLEQKEKKLRDNITRCSQAVTHLSTNRAQRCLTSVIGRELVLYNVIWKLSDYLSYSNSFVGLSGDDYLKARQSLKLRVKDLIKFVENESQLITNDVKSRLDSNRTARAIQLEHLFKKTTGKLDELIKLDVSYGSWMRQKTLLLNDEIKRSFDALERAIDLNEKHITSMLKKLRNDVSVCIESAERNFVACRRHDLLFNFAKCTKEQSDEATKMLDRMNEEARYRFEKIAKFRETVLRAHEMTTQEAIEMNHKKMTDLLRFLEKCIVQLKKSKKWRKKRGTNLRNR